MAGPGISWARALWLAAAVLLASPVLAEPSEYTVVVIVPEASLPVPSQRLTDALTSQLAELGIRVQLSRGPAIGRDAAAAGPSGRRVLAFVWIEGTPEALVVHFYEPAGASLRERRIPVADLDAASLEEVAVVVRSAASALLERADEPFERSEGPEPVAAAPLERAPPPVPPQRTLRVQLALAYSGGLYAPELGWESGLFGSVAWRPVRMPWVFGIGYTWLPPADFVADRVTLEIARRPADVSIGWERPLGWGTSFRATGAVVVDPIRRRTGSAAEPFERTREETRWSWAASTRLRLGWAPAPRWSLFVSGGADFVLNRFEYVVGGEVQTPIISPLRVRPRAHLGVAIDIP